MSQRSNEYRLIAAAVAMFLGGIVLLWVLYLIRDVVLLIYISAILAIGFSPAVSWIEQLRVRRLGRSMPRWAAILVFYVGCLIAVLGVLGVLLPPVVRQAQQLYDAWPQYVAMIRAPLQRFPIGAAFTWADLVKLPNPSAAVTSIVGAVQTAIGAVGAIVTIVVLPYYLLVEADVVQSGFLKLFSEDRRPRVARITENVAHKVGAWLSSQMLLCLIIGTMTSIALWIMGVPYFYVLGVIAGLGELVPVLGPLLGAIPAVLTAFTLSSHLGFGVVAYFAVQQLAENYILIPKLMQRRVGVSPATMLIAFLLGMSLLGVVGALLAIPTAAVIQVLLGEYLDREGNP